MSGEEDPLVDDIRAPFKSISVLEQIVGILTRFNKWPASRKALIEHAEKENAHATVIEKLKKLPDREYKNAADVKNAGA